MSVDHHVSKICNNTDHVIFNDKGNTRCFFQLQLDTYQKCIKLLNTFKNLLQDLISKQFSVHDNDSRIKEIVNVSLSILYGNLVTLLTTKYKSRQLFNLSINKDTIPGYKLITNYSNCGVCQTMSYKINSIRLQFNESTINMIKIVHNNMYNLPESIIFIGKKVNNDISVDALLVDYLLTLDLAIDKLKVHEYTFICLLNSFNSI
jgi:hypothetical protein